MIEAQEMYLAMAHCVERELSPVLLSGDGKFIIDLDPRMPNRPSIARGVITARNRASASICSGRTVLPSRHA